MVSYITKHERVYKAKGKAKEHKCIECGRSAQEWAQIHGTTGDHIDDYQPMCCSCHQKYDNHWNEITKKKVGKSAKERWADADYKIKTGAAISKSKMGHEVSKEARQKIGAAKIGNKFAAGKRTDEQKERMRIARWGR